MLSAEKNILSKRGNEKIIISVKLHLSQHQLDESGDRDKFVFDEWVVGERELDKNNCVDDRGGSEEDLRRCEGNNRKVRCIK